MPDQSKIALRNTIKQLRSKVSPSNRALYSNQICTRIHSLAHYKEAKTIAIYSAIDNEIDLTPLWHSNYLEEKTFYFPVINENLTLSFLPATPETPFKNNKFAIPEPDVNLNLAIPVEELDLVITPLVAFDMRCTRLGTGSGYYDRTLENKKHGLILGVAFQLQLVDFMVPQPWDIPLDGVITQKAIYWRSGAERLDEMRREQ